jgi:hypothetical protein
MSTFTVDPASLDALARTLADLGGQMTSFSSLPTGEAGAVGGAALASEIEHFAGHWKYGVSLLEQHMKAVVENLAKAAGNYEQSDQHVGEACAGGAG